MMYWPSNTFLSNRKACYICSTLTAVVAEHDRDWGGARQCRRLVTAAQPPWGVGARGGFRVREAQRMYIQGSGIIYQLYQCNSNCNNTVNSLWI